MTVTEVTEILAMLGEVPEHIRSLELAWLISEVEQRYHVTLQLGDADLAAMRTIPDAAATLRHLLGQI